MRLHIVSLPHTHTTHDWLTCAYTQKCVKAGRMFTDAGHEVFIYSGQYNDTVCAEHIPVLTEEERSSWFGPRDPNDIGFGGISWDANHPAWVTMNLRAAAAIRERAEKRDLVLLIGGNCQQLLAQNLGGLTYCEFGCGYSGIFSNFVAFESYAWMHHVYGLSNIVNGRYYDAVIPNYFDTDDFLEARDPDDYLLYIGRVTQRKGPHVAALIAERLGMRLIVAGGGVDHVEKRPDGGDRIIADHVVVEGPGVQYVGPVGKEDRAELMAEAVCTLVPTIYVEPFGGVSVEAMLSGCPVVAPDYGCFTETVEPGLTGYRFRTLAEGAHAVELAADLPRSPIRDRAAERFSLEAVAPLYDAWFARLDGLWEDGWYSQKSTLAHPKIGLPL